MKHLLLSLATLGLAVAPSLAQGPKPTPKPQNPPPGRRPQDRPLPTDPLPSGITIVTPREKPPTPEELVEGKRRRDAVVAAHGGERFLKLSGVTFVGKGQASLPGAGEIALDSVTLTFALPDRVRFDVTSVFGEISQVTPGKGKKPFMVMAGQVQDAPFEFRIPDPTAILREIVGRNLAVRPVTDIKDGDKATLSGFVLPDEAEKPTTTLYYDTEKKLLRQIVFRTKQGDLTVNLSGYKTTSRVALPGKFLVLQGKEPLLSLTFSQTTVNPMLNERFFDPPQKAL
jgi:hypothetical protein